MPIANDIQKYRHRVAKVRLCLNLLNFLACFILLGLCNNLATALRAFAAVLLALLLLWSLFGSICLGSSLFLFECLLDFEDVLVGLGDEESNVDGDDKLETRPDEHVVLEAQNRLSFFDRRSKDPARTKLLRVQ